MSATESRPYWTWIVRGLGGIINMAESLTDERCGISDRQCGLLEYQIARLFEVYEKARCRSGHPELAKVRSIDEITATRDFGAEEVLDARRGESKTSVLPVT